VLLLLSEWSSSRALDPATGFAELVIGTVIILAGIVMTFLAQIVGAMLIFRSDGLEGILSLIVPDYFSLLSGALASIERLQGHGR
jgi:hypothetical protein